MSISSSSMHPLQAALVSMIELSAGEWQELLGRLVPRQLPAEAWLVPPGQPCTGIAFMLSGKLRSCYQRADGSEVNFLFHLPGGFATDYESLLTGQPARLGIQALEAAELLILPKEVLHQLYAEARWQRLGRLMAERIYLAAKRRAEELLFLTPTQRYEKLLREQPELVQAVSLKHLASFLGVQPESLSRIRKRLALPGCAGLS